MNRSDSPPAGLGILTCHVCGQRLSDHAIAQPCPDLVMSFGERLVVDRRGRNQSAERKQAWRKKTGKN